MENLLVSTNHFSRQAQLIKSLNQMAVFVHVIESGSFTKAADLLAMNKSVVSAHVAALEARMGVQLIARSTRSLTLTEAGKAFLDECRHMMASADAALSAVESRSTAISGAIRLTASYNLGVNYLIPLLATFRAEHPGLTLDLVLDDSVSNIIDGAFDLAIRVGRLVDSSLFATELGRCRLLVCAAPAILKSLPPITEPEHLSAAPWATIAQLPHPDKLNLVHRDSNELRSIKLNNVAARTTSGIAAMEFVRHGGAIALLPDYAVAQGLEAGELVEVLRDWRELEDRPITALYPSREGMPARVRELIGFLRRSWGRRTSAEGLAGRVGGPVAALRH